MFMIGVKQEKQKINANFDISRNDLTLLKMFFTHIIYTTYTYVLRSFYVYILKYSHVPFVHTLAPSLIIFKLC